jgi:uncharacterized protein
LQKINLVRIASCPAPIRISIFVLVLLLLWLPLAAPIYIWGRNANLVSILTMVLLYGEFIWFVRVWGERVYNQRRILQSYGLVKTRQNGQELLIGLGIGLIAVLSLFSVEGWFGWLIWQQNISLPKIILEGLVSAIAVGFAEELLFRGWLFDELQRDYRPNAVLWATTLIFASLHFIKPLPDMLRTAPQFPGLILLGLTLVWAKRGSKNRLGLPIGIHAGLIWGYYIINVGQLIKYSEQVPDWITGVNQNPLAGVVGIVFLSGIALVMRKRSHLKAKF